MFGIINKEQRLEKSSVEIGYSGHKTVEQFYCF